MGNDVSCWFCKKEKLQTLKLCFVRFKLFEAIIHFNHVAFIFTSDYY